MTMRRDKAINFYKLTRFTADLFSKDPSRKVGCILLKPDSLQVLSLGYNGFPRGIDETDSERWKRPTKYHYCQHAETNSLCNACRSGTSTENSIAIVTLYPCCACCRSLIQAGIKTVVTLPPDFNDPNWGEEFKISKIMFEEAGVEVMFLTEQEVST